MESNVSDHHKPGAAPRALPFHRESALFYATLGLAGLVFAVGIGFYIAQNASVLVANRITSQAYYILLIVMGLSAAIFLFGVLRSTATLTGNQYGVAFDLGGPIVAAVLVVLGGFLLIPPFPEDFNLIVRFTNNDGHPVAEVAQDAWVLVDLDDIRERLQLSPTAEATVRSVPFRFKVSAAAISLESKIFRIKDKKAAYPIPSNGVISLEAELLPSINKPQETPKVLTQIVTGPLL